MNNEMKKASVIGGGIMGSGIAALFANNGIPCTLFDVSKELAQKSLDRLTDPKAKLPLLYSPRKGKLIEACGMDEIASISDSDIVIEAVPEILSLKQDVWGKIATNRKKGSIVTSNTSGLSLKSMTSSLDADTKAHFLGTHFFNPVRYLPLVELMPISETDAAVLKQVEAMLQAFGKKTVQAKDTPNFIANRIGIYAMMKVLALCDKYQIGVEMADMLTGTAIGFPKTGTFRLADMVGLDTLVHASMNSFENCKADPRHGIFKPPAYIMNMVEQKLIGDKAGKGFYQKTGSGPKADLQALQIPSLTYAPSKKVLSDVVKAAKGFTSAKERIAMMLSYDKNATECKFVAELVLDTASYALERVGEICDEALSIDQALRWGFNRELGPIESLDAIGLHRAATMMESFQIPVPEQMRKAMQHGDSFYSATKTGNTYYSYVQQKPAALPRSEWLTIQGLRDTGATLRSNPGGSLYDMGDGVLLFENNSRMVPNMNPIDDFTIAMMGKAKELCDAGQFRALVIGNEAANFCSGAQLQMVLELSKAKQWPVLDAVLKQFQRTSLSFLHAPYPVVVAPHGMALGGGMELSLAGQRRVAYAELYGGLVETGVGLIPAGGGCLLLLMQFTEQMAKANPGPMPVVSKAFELIAYAATSSSADDAMDKGYLKRTDVVVSNKDALLSTAKDNALAMLKDFKQIPEQKLWLPGSSGYLAFYDTIDGMVQSGNLTPHGAVIAKIQAKVLCGGDSAHLGRELSEGDVLALEREAFLSLCGESKTQDRIAHMLKTGKPLFN